MFKFLVLVGFVACALAEPASEEVAPVRRARESYSDCLANCLRRLGAIWNITAGPSCLAYCAFSRSMTDVVPSEQMKMKRMVDFTRPELVGGAPVEVKQCFNKCVADHGTSGDNFNYCIIGCNLGGQKLVEKEGVDPTGGRQARGIDSCLNGYCRYVAGIPPALVPCMAVCLAAGGRRRSIPKDEMIPAIDVDFKPQLRDRKSDCVRSCFPGPTYFMCTSACNRLSGRSVEDGARSLKDDSSAVDGKREARMTRRECIRGCALTGPVFNACVATACKGLSDRSLAGASSLPTDSASLMQITEPIANILSQVIKKQQELEKMIQSCNCATPLTPFGLENGALGPYF